MNDCLGRGDYYIGRDEGQDERLYDMIFFAEAAPRGGWNYDTFD